MKVLEISGHVSSFSTAFSALIFVCALPAEFTSPAWSECVRFDVRRRGSFERLLRLCRLGSLISPAMLGSTPTPCASGNWDESL